jgi:Spy/CpxP family protein refolding chaperone
MHGKMIRVLMTPLALIWMWPVGAQAQHDHENPAGAVAEPGKPSVDHQMQGHARMGMGSGQMDKMGTMMAAEMKDPFHQALMAVFALPEMQKELGLSAQQVQQMGEMKQQFLAKQEAGTERISAEKKELDTLLATASPQLHEVRRQLSKIAALESEQKYAGFETAANMKAALTADQRAKFAAMKPEEVHQIMMSRVPMEQHHAMMGMMGGH